MDEEYLTLLERAYKLVAPKAQRRAEIPKIEVRTCRARRWYRTSAR
jgi:translation initiation factor 2 subunit 2